MPQSMGIQPRTFIIKKNGQQRASTKMSNNYKVQANGSAGTKPAINRITSAESSGWKNDVLMSVEVKTKKKQSDLGLIES